MNLVFRYSRQAITFVASVVLSLFLVSMMAFGATYIDVDSVGIATDTPGAALAVKGAALIDGFIHTDFINATSTAATSSMPMLNSKYFINAYTMTAGLLKATSTMEIAGTGTSTIGGSLLVNATALVVDSGGDAIGVGTTSFSGLSGDVSPSIVVGAGAASSTLYLSGGPTVGSTIILTSSNGTDCVLIVANAADADADGNVPLVGRTTVCPAP